MNKSISITLSEETWKMAIDRLLDSDKSYLQMLGQTLLRMLILEKNLQDIKEKAHI